MEDKKCNIKIIKSIFYSRVFTVEGLRQPITKELIFFFHGTEFAHLSLSLPIIFPIFFLAFGLNNAIGWTIIYFYVLFFLRITQFYNLKKKYAESDYDFIVTTTKGGGDPNPDDINQQRICVLTKSTMKGFRNGLKFVLMTNVNFEMAFDDVVVESVKEDGSSFSISKQYFNAVARFYRFFGII